MCPKAWRSRPSYIALHKILTYLYFLLCGVAPQEDIGIGGVVSLLWFRRRLPTYVTKFIEMVGAHPCHCQPTLSPRPLWTRTHAHCDSALGMPPVQVPSPAMLCFCLPTSDLDGAGRSWAGRVGCPQHHCHCPCWQGLGVLRGGWLAYGGPPLRWRLGWCVGGGGREAILCRP